MLRRGAVELRVLGPLHASLSTPRNDAALVILARQGTCSFLLPADAESPVLLTDGLPRVGVLEVAHHGSDDPRLARLLAQLRPRLAVISVGARNTYGHPAASTLTALARGRCACPPHRSRGLHRARLRRGRVTQIRSRRCLRPRSIPST